jgi:hypothetical protein
MLVAIRVEHTIVGLTACMKVQAEPETSRVLTTNTFAQSIYFGGVPTASAADVADEPRIIYVI